MEFEFCYCSILFETLRRKPTSVALANCRVGAALRIQVDQRTQRAEVALGSSPTPSPQGLCKTALANT